MEFSISPTNSLPIYQQLTEQICAAVARGRLQPDERLPSVRELSQLLVINPNTVARAYTELERTGVLYTRAGLGVFVSHAQPRLAKKVRRERLLNGLDQLLVTAVQVGCSADEVLELVEERLKQFQWQPATASS